MWETVKKYFFNWKIIMAADIGTDCTFPGWLKRATNKTNAVTLENNICLSATQH